MTRELPFPIAFELPDGWALVSPDDSGQADAAYVAVRDTNTADPVAANLAISGLGLHDAAVDVAVLAAAQLANLQAQYPVTVLKRDVITTGPTRQAAQLLQIDYPVGETTITLRQIRIVTAFRGAEDPAAVAVLALLMTCPVDVFDHAGSEFGQFVASIARAATPEKATRDDQVGEQISAAAAASTLDRQPGQTGV